MTDMKGLVSLTEMRDAETKRTNAMAQDLKLSFGQELARLER